MTSAYSYSISRLQHRHLQYTDTNIFTDIFLKSILKINTELEPEDAQRLLDDISLKLDNEDFSLV